ncbi:MAG: thiol:disulfide interchange protein DsbA/DsbL [Burkholderiales bacterium]|nr:thiol:disulfide interchange protein DsbA/DsbL [Burkholderiales bacterium]
MSDAFFFTAIGRAARVLAAAVVVAAFAPAANAQNMVEGQNYVRLRNPQPVETGKNIEVIEFFSYGCPHCGELEPVLQGWLKSKPADVQFRRIPVMFQPKWENLAKAYYALEAMGEESKLSPEIFLALHQKGLPLSNEKDFLDWAATKGIDRKKLADLLNSFAVIGRVNRAKQLAQVYQIQSVPTIIVDGKYTTGPERLKGGHAGVPVAIDALVQKARAERPKS